MMSGTSQTMSLVLIMVLAAPDMCSGSLSTKEKQELLDAHNFYRRKEVRDRSAIGLRQMEWDTKLEDFANKYLQRCRFQHSQYSERNKAGRYPEVVGENIFRTAQAKIHNLTYAIWMFYDEGKYWDYGGIKCQTRKECGHYIQVVWYETFRMGCGVKRCAKFTLLHCNYAPSKKGFRNPYNKGGNACGSSCPEQFPECVDRLCGKAGAKITTVPPGKSLAVATPRGDALAGYLSSMWVIFVTSLVSLHGQ